MNTRNKKYIDDIHQNGSKPNYSKNQVNDFISKKSLSNMVGTSITFTATPYDASLPNTAPFPIVNKLNSHIGGGYVGNMNLDGGNVQQYANSLFSKFHDYADTMAIRLRFNYRYIPTYSDEIDGVQISSRIIDGMIQSIDEVVSRLDSTTFTVLNINQYVVETDMPMGVNSNTTTIAGKTVYTNTADVIFASTMVYQMILQNYGLVFNNHNGFRLKMGEMVRMEYDRNMTTLNSFYGLLNKAAFKALWNSIAMNLHGEYFDYDFMTQLNTMVLVPSRKSESIIEPLQEISASVSLPNKFALYVKTTNGQGEDSLIKVFDLDDMGTSDKSFIDIVEELNDILTATDTLNWVRNYGTANQNVNGRYNVIVKLVETLVEKLNFFKRSFIDVRSVFNVLGRVGINNWSTNVRLGITPETDAKVFHNFVVADIFKSALAGAAIVEFSDITKRFRTFSLWDIYNGIPEFDAYSGGAFLTFSFKEVSLEGDDNDGSVGYIPRGIEYRSSNEEAVVAITRNGYRIDIDAIDTQFIANDELIRLVPLGSQESLSVKVPTVNDDNLTAPAYSALIRVLLSNFGLCQVNGQTFVSEDLLAIYQIELEDISNDMLTYSKAYAPFKTVDTKFLGLGFLGSYRK